MEVPGYRSANITDIHSLGPHEYDAGLLSLSERITQLVNLERNGLVYTCRGGFVDTAHVRDYADLTLFLTARFAAELPGPVRVSVSGDGGRRRIRSRRIDEELLARVGTWEAAVTLAQHVAFQLSVWHEIATWYGYASTLDFPEKVSAFSPEDLYSNALGVGLAGGLLRTSQIRLREDYNRLASAWLAATLRYLGAVDEARGRGAMSAVEGLWWNASKTLPDWTLVTRRNLDIATLAPWRLEDVVNATGVRDEICPDAPPPLVLRIATKLGDVPISEIVDIVIEPEGDWVPDGSPLMSAKPLTSDDFPKIIDAIRRDAARTLGEAFDTPGARR
jgi:hypothetical protein